MSYSYSANWADLYGLKSQDLTESQLAKIEFKKLAEFCSSDSRVERIIGDKLLTENIKNIEVLKKFSEDDVKKMSYLLDKYNECLRVRKTEVDAQVSGYYYYRRENFYFYNLLDEENKLTEYNLWLTDEPSIIDVSKIDYEWLYEKDSFLAERILLKVFGRNIKEYNKEAAIARAVSSAPKDTIIRYADYIYENHGSKTIHMLSNKHTPKKLLIKIFRDWAGRKKVPNIDVYIHKDVLAALPSVMRLSALETFLIHKRRGEVEFVDIESEEELHELLFGTSLRYNSRVQAVVNKFRIIQNNK